MTRARRHVAVTEQSDPGAPRCAAGRRLPGHRRVGAVQREAGLRRGRTPGRRANQIYGPFRVGSSRWRHARPSRGELRSGAARVGALRRPIGAARDEARKRDSRACLGVGFADPGVTTHTCRSTCVRRASTASPPPTSPPALGLPSREVRAAVSQGASWSRTRVGRLPGWYDRPLRRRALLLRRGDRQPVHARQHVLAAGQRARSADGRSAVPRPSAAPGGVFASTERFEQDVIPSINATLETEVDFWYWDGINAASTNRIRTFELMVPDAVAGTATLEARFAGATNGAVANDHHAILRLNGVEVGTVVWGGIERFEAAITFDGSAADRRHDAGGRGDSRRRLDGFDLLHRRLRHRVPAGLPRGRRPPRSDRRRQRGDHRGRLLEFRPRGLRPHGPRPGRVVGNVLRRDGGGRLSGEFRAEDGGDALPT